MLAPSGSQYKPSKSRTISSRAWETGFLYEQEPNPYWNVIITMATVGYGDLFPVTHYGRIFSVISMFFGQFVSSLILLGMGLASDLQMEESKAFKKLKQIEFHHSQMVLAAHIISTHALIRLINKGYKSKRYAKIGPYKALMKLSIQAGLLRRRFKENYKYFWLMPVATSQTKPVTTSTLWSATSSIS